MSELPAGEALFERGGEKFGPAYMRKILQILQSEDVYVDFSKGGDKVESRQIKAEMYALVAYFIERSFPHFEKWVNEHPGMLPNVKDGDTYDTSDGFGVISFAEFSSEFERANSSSENALPEEVFQERINRAVSALALHSFSIQVPEDILAFEAEAEEEDVEEHISAKDATQDQIVQAHFNNLFKETNYREKPVTFRDFVLQGVGTAGLVMTSLALVAPILSKSIYGDTIPEHVAQCRTDLYGIISDLTSLHIDKFNHLKRLEGEPDPHTLEGIMGLIQGEDLGSRIRFSLRADVKKELESIEFDYDEDPVREDMVGCPAMYGKSSAGVINKYLWNYVSYIASKTFDQAIDLEEYAARFKSFKKQS